MCRLAGAHRPIQNKCTKQKQKISRNRPFWVFDYMPFSRRLFRIGHCHFCYYYFLCILVNNINAAGECLCLKRACCAKALQAAAAAACRFGGCLCRNDVAIHDNSRLSVSTKANAHFKYTIGDPLKYLRGYMKIYGSLFFVVARASKPTMINKMERNENKIMKKKKMKKKREYVSVYSI